MIEELAISSELDHLDRVRLSEMSDVQGTLKELPAEKYNKLKALLEDRGIIIPFFLWTKDNGLLDGNQRKKVISENWGDMEVPVIYIEASTLERAKETLLAISSQFGEITEEGLESFGLDMGRVKEAFSFDRLPFVFTDYEAPPQMPDMKKLYENMPGFQNKNLYANSQRIALWIHSDDARNELNKLLGLNVTPDTKTAHYPPSGAITFNSRDFQYGDGENSVQ